MAVDPMAVDPMAVDPMAVVAFNVLPSPESEMSLSPLELINDEFKKSPAKKASRSVTK
jgi:hypothetical protein